MAVNNRKSEQEASAHAGDCMIISKRSLKLLGVMLDDKLSFGKHVEYACKRASMAIEALSRMMVNSSPVCSSKRRLLAAVAVSIHRYGSSVWASALRVERNAKLLASTHRLMCLRVISAYRTVSGDAACVVACMMPIGLLIKEDAECYDMRRDRNARRTANASSLRE
ncbi:uncharacterized protein LOC131433803 [Malaya genurostris]|uniref:uncharacterized protein LOC131433803 n=1 Tax=Malaya genurostris TaxID=325434 RepID=UPI0026F397F6|nr:uncharacterized protein LOC131433803 [Malaya genurostris]